MAAAKAWSGSPLFSMSYHFLPASVPRISGSPASSCGIRPYISAWSDTTIQSSGRDSLTRRPWVDTTSSPRAKRNASSWLRVHMVPASTDTAVCRWVSPHSSSVGKSRPTQGENSFCPTTDTTFSLSAVYSCATTPVAVRARQQTITMLMRAFIDFSVSFAVDSQSQFLVVELDHRKAPSHCQEPPDRNGLSSEADEEMNRELPAMRLRGNTALRPHGRTAGRQDGRTARNVSPRPRNVKPQDRQGVARYGCQVSRRDLENDHPPGEVF